ncbi:hypothetical protein ABH990_002998 [Bradyrhizobium ottawaense]
MSSAPLGASRAGCAGDDRRERDRENGTHREAELGHGIALDQISDRGGVHEHTGDVAPGLLHGACRRGQGTSCRRRAVIPAGQAHRGELAVLEIQDRTKQHDLAVESAAKKVAVTLFDAGAQIDERVGRDVASQPPEVERHCIRHGTRDRVAGQFGRARGRNLGLCARRARSELDRHRGDRPPLDGKAQRHPSDDVVVVGVDIERPHGVAHGDLLGAIGHFRMVIAQDFAEHQFAAVGDLPKRDQVIPIESLHAAANGGVAKRNLRLLD